MYSTYVYISCFQIIAKNQSPKLRTIMKNACKKTQFILVLLLVLTLPDFMGTIFIKHVLSVYWEEDIG